MSRIGKKPISIPAKIKVSFENRTLAVEGPKGSIEKAIHPDVNLKIENGAIRVVAITEGKKTNALWGLTRSLVVNMITGVDKGFERILEINGIGYRANINGNRIELNLGYSHPVLFDLPAGIQASVDRNTIIRLAGVDKELLGQTAASLRRLKPPDSYKGKGIRYTGERIRLKAGKTGTK
ncbi:MAG: 50S ribosomal protein L6 [Deltaproteobacteria bacterium RBG_13_49_15]|nr:MAG: 50S ribosomal protein L6 [Deltaproteobacteria bacterium RBG_13_49_15]